MLLIAVLCFTQLSYAQELFDHPRSLEDLDGDDNQILDGADADGSPGSSSSTGTPVQTPRVAQMLQTCEERSTSVERVTRVIMISMI